MSEEAEPKYVLSEDQPANATAAGGQPQLAQKADSSDVAIPKWPSYTQPMKQYDAIKTELQQVKSEKQHWDKLLKEAEAASKTIKKDDTQAVL